jgi:hypothetical protein
MAGAGPGNPTLTSQKTRRLGWGTRRGFEVQIAGLGPGNPTLAAKNAARVGHPALSRLDGRMRPSLRDLWLRRRCNT